MEETRGFKGLDVYQKAYKLSLEIHRLSFKFPKEEQFGLASQIRRASTSIPLNIAEGYGRRESKGDYLRFIQIAKGSAFEMLVLLDYAKDVGYIEPRAEHNSLYSDYEEVIRMLVGLRKHIEKS